MVEKTLFEKLFESDLLLSSNFGSIDGLQRTKEIERQMEEMHLLSETNPIFATMLNRNSDPFEVVENHRRRKMSKLGGISRWTPWKYDQAHNAENDSLSEIFSNIEHYRTRGIMALDNPVTIGGIATTIGLMAGAHQLVGSSVYAVLNFFSAGQDVNLPSAQDLLVYSELGLMVGGLAGYHRRTRRTRALNGSIKNHRVWDQAQYMERKIEEFHRGSVREIEEYRKKPFAIRESEEENKINNSYGNEVFKALGIKSVLVSAI